jgi:hypothetical protein
MKKLRIYNFDLRVGDTDYAGYGSYYLIGLSDPTPTTVNNFMDIYVPKEEREGVNPVNLLDLDREGENLDAYFPQEDLLSLLNDFDFQRLNNGYLVYEGIPEDAAIYSEETEYGILIDKNTKNPLFVTR